MSVVLILQPLLLCECCAYLAAFVVVSVLCFYILYDLFAYLAAFVHVNNRVFNLSVVKCSWLIVGLI